MVQLVLQLLVVVVGVVVLVDVVGGPRRVQAAGEAGGPDVHHALLPVSLRSLRSLRRGRHVPAGGEGDEGQRGGQGQETPALA